MTNNNNLVIFYFRYDFNIIVLKLFQLNTFSIKVCIYYDFRIIIRNRTKKYYFAYQLLLNNLTV